MAYLLALVGGMPGGRIRRVLKPVTLHPGQHHAVAFVDVGDLPPLGHDHPGGFVPKHQRPGQRRVVHLVELRVADPGGKLFDDNVGRTRVTDIQVIDNQ